MKKKSLPWLAAPALLLAGGLAFFLARPAVMTRGMNLLVVTIDTMRADRLGCYGDRLAATPDIDALAKRGALFANAYAPAPLTLPAHCSLFTGLWPFAHGVRNNAFYALGSGVPTLAERLKASGYDTSALVAAYVLKGKFGLNRGFDLYDDGLGPDEKVGNYDAEIPADRVYRKFQGWLGRERRGPFFLWVHFYDPHKPYDPPREYLDMTRGDAYRGEAAYASHYIGRIVEDLERRGLLERTLVVVAGDHGEAFGEHGESGHGVFCYEESLRVPLIFSNPRLFKKPVRVASRARLVDVMPTVLEMLTGETDEASHGRSLRAAMKGREDEAPRVAYLESLYGREENNWAPLTGLIRGSLKYIALPRPELYDLRADPLERDNLLLKDEGQAREWKAELARFVRDHRPDGEPGTRPALSPAEKERLESLGYVSSAAASARAGLDPKIGIVYQNRIAELVAALDRGETDRVEREAEGLIAETRDLKLPYAYTLLGLVYEKKRDWPRLRDHLLRAIEAFGDEPAQAEKFRGNLLELYLAGGQYGPAEELARDILAHDPRQARALEILGEIGESREDWAGALDHYLGARENEPGNASIGRRVLKMRLRLGDHKAAAAEIESLLSTEDGAVDAELLFTAAMLRVEAGDGPGAEELLRRVTELKPSAKSYFDYALVLGRNGKVGPAAASMEKALAFVPSDLDAEMREAAARALRLWRERPR